jgi:hypothetical protein
VVLLIVLSTFTKRAQPRGKVRSAAVEWLGEHSLTLFLLVTGIAWVVAFKAMDPNRSMGTSGWQHRFRVDPDPGVGSDDQAPDGGWLQGALTAVRTAYTPHLR